MGRHTAMTVGLAAHLLSLPTALPAQSLSLEAATGQQVFERLWVAAPASTRASDGLGPLYAARSCDACHPGGGAGGDAGRVLRLSGDPVYGSQFDTRAVSGIMAEGDLTVAPGPDGAPVSTLTNLAYGPMDPQTHLSLRAAPDLARVAALRAIPQAAIRAMADPDDMDGDGISGRLPLLPDGRIGRFGHKASQPDLAAQIASAFHRDMGLSTLSHPDGAGDCTDAQTACRAAADGNSPEHGGVEVAPQLIPLIEAYLMSLAPPAHTDADGAALFSRTGCADCHTPQYGAFSDGLLHDMGAGLADDLVEGAAAGSEWRTAPLVGLSGATSYLLHDGRAGSIPQAISWHGGEADPARRAFEALSPEDRATLIAYLETL